MINVSNLKYTYKKTGTNAIAGIDFDIEQGQIFGFLGPSGAGKTTTQKVIIGLLRGYSGSVKIMGRERKEWNKDFFERIGVAFEFPNLYLKLTAVENLSLIGSYYKNSGMNINQLIERVGLTKDANKKVEGYSKGMKMRLNFIRSIMHEPDILFIDEPTSGLDPTNAKIVKDIIIELRERGKTVFLTTHNMTIAEQLCDKVAFIVDGKISVIDNPKELMLNHGKRMVKVGYVSGEKLLDKNFAMKNLGKNTEFLDIIKNREIKTIHTQEATLEDIFIKLTGKILSK